MFALTGGHILMLSHESNQWVHVTNEKKSLYKRGMAEPDDDRKL